MCGIFGIVQDNVTQDNILSGLKYLEYRGYDSCGLSIMKAGQVIVKKKTGRVKELEKLCENLNLSGDVGLGHCRWATCGMVTDVNAHPHSAKDITLVHNGIVENYIELKEYVQGLGCVLESETDTEIIAHLIALEEGTLLERVSKAIKELQGSYALAVVSEKESNCIVVAKHQSPLIVGKYNGGSVIASDLQALLPLTNKVSVMLDGEIGLVTKDSIEFYNVKGKVNKEIKTIPWNFASSNLGNFDTYMKKEIYEQPTSVIDTVLKNSWSDFHKNLQILFADLNNIVFTACGTSFHACLIGANLVERFANVRCSVKLAGEFKTSNYFVGKDTLVIAVSQSGETADTINAVKDAKSRGAKVLAVVNIIGSSLEREADLTLHTIAGPEISVASTKAFTAQLVVLYMITAILKHLQVPYAFGKENLINHVIAKIGMMPDILSKILQVEQQIKELALTVSKAKSVLYMGRGLGFPICLEGALKLKEISYIHAEGIAASELKHGSIALIEYGSPVIAIATKSQDYNKMLFSIQEVKTRGAWVVSIATEGDDKITKISDEVIFVPEVEEMFNPLLEIIPLQLLAYHTAKILGREIDYPKNLAKSCTVE